MSQEAHHFEGYPGFCIIKCLGVFLPPPGWGASPAQGYPSMKFAGTQLIHLGPMSGKPWKLFGSVKP